MDDGSHLLHLNEYASHSLCGLLAVPHPVPALCLCPPRRPFCAPSLTPFCPHRQAVGAGRLRPRVDRPRGPAHLPAAFERDGRSERECADRVQRSSAHLATAPWASSAQDPHVCDAVRARWSHRTCAPAGTVPAQVLTNDATSIVTTGMAVQPVAPNDPSSSAVVDTGTFLKPDAIDDPGAPSSDSLGAISSSAASAVEVRLSIAAGGHVPARPGELVHMPVRVP